VAKNSSCDNYISPDIARTMYWPNTAGITVPHHVYKKTFSVANIAVSSA